MIHGECLTSTHYVLVRKERTNWYDALQNMERSLLWLFYFLEMPHEILGSMTSQNPWFTRFGKVHQEPRGKPKAWKGKKVRRTRIGYHMAVWVSHFAPNTEPNHTFSFVMYWDSPPTNAVRLAVGRTDEQSLSRRASRVLQSTTNRWLTRAWGLFQKHNGGVSTIDSH
jgi:hypothetical protein